MYGICLSATLHSSHKIYGPNVLQNVQFTCAAKHDITFNPQLRILTPQMNKKQTYILLQIQISQPVYNINKFMQEI